MTSQTDLENVKSLLIQTIDTPSKKVRVAAAQSLAFVLLSVMADEKQNETLTESSTREPKKKRPSAGVKPDDEDDGRASPAPGKVANAISFRLQFQEILRQLSTNYARTASRYIRNGLTLSYSIIFKTLGGHSASANYSAILDHLLTNVASHPLVGDDRFRALEARRHIDYLLGHVLRRQLLAEPAKMMAIRTIIDALQKKAARKSSDSDAWPVEATVAGLSEVAGLIQDLGSAVSLEQV
jgi:HEAT repeat-containing protein 5